MAADVYTLPAGLPVPVDDGAADHLRGAAVPSLVLPATSGDLVDLAVVAAGPAGSSSSRPGEQGSPQARVG